MKKIFTHILLISAAICLASTTASAQPSKDVVLSKVVTGPDSDGEYLITLEAYATGESVTTISEDVKPCDIVVILDLSKSMVKKENNITVNKEPQKLSKGTELTVGTTYKVTIDGTEYYLKGFTQAQPLDRTGYSYNSVENGDFYYQYNGGWYKVSGYKTYGTRYLTVDVNGTTYYIRSNGQLTANIYSAASSSRDSDIIWTGVLYAPPVYSYRYGTTEPTSATSGSEFYTGTSNYVVGYEPASGVGTVTKIETLGGTGTESVTRLEATERAAKKFVETVYQNSPESGSHRIAIVGFNERAKDIVAFGNLDSEAKVSTAQSLIDGIPTGTGEGQGTNTADYGVGRLGWYTSTNWTPSSIGQKDGDYRETNPATGLKRAAEIFSNFENDGRKRVVVFFTDGVPAPKGTDSFSNVYATSAVNWAYILKQPLTSNINYTYKGSESLSGNTAAANDSYSGTGLGASVYSVAVLGGTDGGQIRHMLHWISSNYPDKYFGNTTGTFPDDYTGEAGEGPKDYYQLSKGSDLTSIFETIAGQASSTGGATTTLNSETTTVVDVLSANFTLPENADETRIGLYTQSVTGGTSMDNLTWGSRQNLVPAGGKQSDYVKFNDVTDSDGNSTKEIEVKGFDFTLSDADAPNGKGNWVGPRTTKENGNDKTEYWGKKLVITIPIVPAPGYSGGYDTPTNTVDSGIKSGDSWVARFDVPTVDFPSIGIVKTGLNAGESAIFTVQRTHSSNPDGTVIAELTDQPVYTIVVTGDGTNAKYAILKNIPEGKYTVTETSWSWAYTPDPAEYTEAKVLYKDGTTDWPSGISETSKCVIFTFNNREKSNLPDHAESVVVNTFKGAGVTTTSAVTTNSKE